jgi:hypothetical protein
VKLKYSAKAHGYWLDGKRCKSPSAIAKVPDDMTALNNWKRRQTAIGLALRPDLLTQIAAAGDDKKIIDAVCEMAMEVAGATTGRDRGTAVHRITERLDDGDAMLETPEVITLRQQWLGLLDRYDLEVVQSEGVIVHPELMIAGRFDRVVRHKITGELLILDIKTGADADRFHQANALQLWLYASAPLIGVGPQGDVDFEITAFDPMVAVSQRVALIAHLPADKEPDIIALNIERAGRCFGEVVVPTWEWRGIRSLRIDEFGKKPAAVETVNAADDTRDNLLRRCRKVAELSPAGAEWLKAELVKRGLNVRQATVAEFPLILEVLEQAETYVSAPFDPLPVPPVAPAVSDRVAAPTLDATPDEGPLVFTDEDDTFAEMKAAYGALDDAGRSWVSQIVTESIQAGRSLHMVDARSLRRVRVALGLALLAGDGTEGGCCVRALVHLATGVDAVLFPSVPLGAAVSIMSADEAEVFVASVRLFLDGKLIASVDAEGHVRLGVAA